MNKLTKTELNNIYVLGENRTGKPIFIDFYADWGGPCKMFKQVLEEVVPEYENKIKMYEVNIEDEPGIAQQFGARSIPYMVFISKSGERQPQIGVLDKDTLKYYFEGLIRKK